MRNSSCLASTVRKTNPDIVSKVALRRCKYLPRFVFCICCENSKFSPTGLRMTRCMRDRNTGFFLVADKHANASKFCAAGLVDLSSLWLLLTWTRGIPNNAVFAWDGFLNTVWASGHCV